MRPATVREPFEHGEPRHLVVGERGTYLRRDGSATI
jgi:hypothetical protein